MGSPNCSKTWVLTKKVMVWGNCFTGGHRAALKLCIMTHLFLTVLLLLASESAYGEWTVFATDGKGNTVYIDRESVLRKGNTVKIWVLLDGATVHETVEGRPFLSSRTLHQYDCQKERFRFLGFALFSEHMGSGQLVESNQYALDWERVPPKGSARRLLDFVCNKNGNGSAKP